MDWKQGYDETLVTEYLELTRITRLYSKMAIKGELFPHLTTRHKKSIQKNNPEDYLIRVNFLFRPNPYDKEEDSDPNINVGNLEGIIVVNAPLNDETDYKRGIDTDNPNAIIRPIKPELLLSSGYFDKVLRFFFHNSIDRLTQALKKGDYLEFVMDSLKVFDNSMKSYKEHLC